MALSICFDDLVLDEGLLQQKKNKIYGQNVTKKERKKTKELLVLNHPYSLQEADAALKAFQADYKSATGQLYFTLTASTESFYEQKFPFTTRFEGKSLAFILFDGMTSLWKFRLETNFFHNDLDEKSFEYFSKDILQEVSDTLLRSEEKEKERKELSKQFLNAELINQPRERKYSQEELLAAMKIPEEIKHAPTKKKIVVRRKKKIEKMETTV